MRKEHVLCKQILTKKYDQTIAIAYRGWKKNGQVVRNHYESVCYMNSNDILAATDLAMKSFIFVLNKKE